MEFRLPPLLYNAKGEIRKAGFELEFSGTDLETTASCILRLFGGKHIRHNHFLHEVTDTEFGNFSLKMDTRVLTNKTYDKALDKIGLLKEEEKREKLVEAIASIVVPYEVGTPPVPMTELHRLDALREELHQQHAKGTKTSPLHAFATHVNAELPDTELSTLLNYLRAFLLLYPWLFDRSKIDFTRKIATYIRPFPNAYTQLVLRPDYSPDFDVLVNDYHRYNPDRNRPLDLYPALAYLNKDKVFSFEGIGNVKPRPAFHYRLPNSLIDKQGWSLASEWNCWIMVEKLASDPEKIGELSKEYLALYKNSFAGFNNKWIKKTDKWIEC